MKVLIVEDSKLQSMFIASIVEQSGHNYEFAYTGHEALSLYENYQPDLIILDIELPGMKGFEVAKKIREAYEMSSSNVRIKWTPIIFLTALQDDKYIEIGIQSGGDDYMNKPPSVPILKSKIFAMERLVKLQNTVYEQQSLIKHREKMKSLQTFSAGVAHEIRNPLAAIIQSGQNLLRRLNTDLPVNRKSADEIGVDIAKINEYAEKRGILKFIHDIHEAGARVANIINSLLQVTEETEGQQYETAIFTVIDKATEFLKSESDLTEETSLETIQIEKQYAQGLPYVLCCVDEMARVIYDVLKNAVYAVSFNIKDPKVLVKVECIGENLVIEVHDNGMGMDNETLSHAFEPFFTTKAVGDGVGLGLTVAYSIVTNKHNGNIELESKLGRGTIARITIPLNGSECIQKKLVEHD